MRRCGAARRHSRDKCRLSTWRNYYKCESTVCLAHCSNPDNRARVQQHMCARFRGVGPVQAYSNCRHHAVSSCKHSCNYMLNHDGTMRTHWLWG